MAAVNPQIPRALLTKLFLNLISNEFVPGPDRQWGSLRDQWISFDAIHSFMVHRCGIPAETKLDHLTPAIMKGVEQTKSLDATKYKPSKGRSWQFLWLSYKVIPHKAWKRDEGGFIVKPMKEDWSSEIAYNQRMTDAPKHFVTSLKDRREANDVGQLDFEVAAFKERLVARKVSYWTTAYAKKLFSPYPNQTVKECLEQRIGKLEKAINCFGDPREEVVELKEDQSIGLDFSDYQHQLLVYKCRHLKAAYELALVHMGNNKTWKWCCQKAADSMKVDGLEVWGHKGVARLNIEFRSREHFANPIKNTECQVELFAIFPEAKALLTKWGEDNLETLTGQAARLHLLDEIFPYLLVKANKELEQHGIPDMSMTDFMCMCRLKNLSPPTVWKWMRLLGFSYDLNKKCYYTDGHERPDNRKCRMEFIKKCLKDLEIRTYRWTQVAKSKAVDWEKDKKLRFNSTAPFHSYQDPISNVEMQEHHIDEVHFMPGIAELVDAGTPKDFGANLSVQKPADARPLIVIGQDESTINQWIFSSRGWTLHGETTLKPKSEGEGVMMIAFVTDAHGFKGGIEFNLGLLEEINRRREGQHYVSTEAALNVNNKTLKPLLTEEMFTDDKVDSPFFKMFRCGAKHKGHWNNDRMKLQFEDVVDCLKAQCPGHDLTFLFDQSSGHTKQRLDGLNANNMIRLHGGKTAGLLRDTLVAEETLGPCLDIARATDPTNALKAGDTQQMVWPTVAELDANESVFVGPNYIKPSQRKDLHEH